MICAGDGDGAHTTCNGDSGGPLMVFDDAAQRWLQVGIVSWGNDGCTDYSVYAHVSALSHWISEQAPELATPTPRPTDTPTPTPTATPTMTSTPSATPTGVPTKPPSTPFALFLPRIVGPPGNLYLPYVTYTKLLLPLRDGDFEQTDGFAVSNFYVDDVALDDAQINNEERPVSIRRPFFSAGCIPGTQTTTRSLP